MIGVNRKELAVAVQAYWDGIAVFSWQPDVFGSAFALGGSVAVLAQQAVLA